MSASRLEDDGLGADDGGETLVESIRSVAFAMTVAEGVLPFPSIRKAAGEARFGPVLIFLMALTVVLHGMLWVSGARPSALAQAVEQGAARVESRRIGEVGDDPIRKAIQTQRETLAFWTTLARLGDFLGEPLALALRSLAAATCLSALAALAGRPVRYERALAECSAVQGFWVLGLAVRVALTILLRRPDAETSATLFLAPGAYPAATWLALRQLDAFALIGWAALASGARRRGQTRLAGAVAVCTPLALAEALLRVSLGLATGSAMRLEVLTK